MNKFLEICEDVAAKVTLTLLLVFWFCMIIILQAQFNETFQRITPMKDRPVMEYVPSRPEPPPTPFETAPVIITTASVFERGWVNLGRNLPLLL